MIEVFSAGVETHGVVKLPIPWQALLLSVGIYVALPLVAGYVSRIWIIRAKGEAWFQDKFMGC